MGNKNGLGHILSDRSELIKTIFLVALTGFSINLASSLIIEQSNIPRYSIWIFVAVVFVFSVYSIARIFFNKSKFSESIDAAIFINKEKNELIPVKGYDFSRKTHEILNAIKAENKAIYADWDRDPICKKKDISNGKKDSLPKGRTYIAISRMEGAPDLEQKSSALLMEEIALFVCIDMLSTHLSGYFGGRKGDSNVKEFCREDFPEFLMSNRIINLLSTPMEKRPIFLEAFPDSSKRPEGEIVSLWGSDGSVFSRFDLVLPEGSKISQSSRNGVKISTRRLSLSISVKLGFSVSGYSNLFCKHYMGVPWDSVEGKKVKIDIEGEINPWFLFISRGWDYYHWLDSFRDKLLEKTSFSHFKKSISWDSLIEPLIFSSRDKQMRSPIARTAAPSLASLRSSSPDSKPAPTKSTLKKPTVKKRTLASKDPGKES
ncbi:hypothetical protein [Sphingopyxis sp.]|uniref:hypothetical protein n=1 Tax=Sphingopyxis sp. TaxID=1908224 RepID=UPI0025DFCC7B|nr:hypothetical protein [Sphingopyxis sp.]MBR2171817.1 hypothetical protein [Sphingopyxis sp.]